MNLACYMIISTVYIAGYMNEDSVACSQNTIQKDVDHEYYSETPSIIVEQVSYNLR